MAGKKKDKVKKVRKPVSEKTRKTMLNVFILLFPSMIIVLLMADLPLTVYGIALFFYQAILVKNFISDIYDRA